MATARDWLKTLWPASYKGTPFFVDRDEEGGGRRIVIHQFPMRDDPYLEDLGEDKRDFEVTAYVASDSADTDAGALVATCATSGAGVLVLPTHGQLTVRCPSFTRNRDKDRAGYIAFALRFIREGAASSLVTVASLANQVFLAADNLTTASASSFAANFQVSAQPGYAAPSSGSNLNNPTPVDFVVAAAANGLQDAASTLESVRTTEPVDPTVSSAQRDAIQTIFTQTPDLLADPATVASVPTQLFASARSLGDGLAPATAIRAFDAVVNGAATTPAASTFPTANAQAAANNAAAASRVLRLAALTAYSEAVARVPLTDRPSAITLRANVADYFEAEIIDLPASEIALIHAICAIRDSVIEYLSLSILNLAPVITVQANLSMPSLYWAWRLYQDPTRSPELVARNLVMHPSFMPPTFEALAR
jgi:prophage DNA circulation protein